MTGFIVGFMLGFSFHYALWCTKPGQNACKKCFDFFNKSSKK